MRCAVVVLCALVAGACERDAAGVAAGSGSTADAAPATIDASTTTGPGTTRPPTTTTSTSSTSTTSTTSTTTWTTSTTSTTSASTTTTTTTTTLPSHDPAVCDPAGSSIWEVRPPSPLAAPALPGGWTVEPIGTSSTGRPIDALVRAAATPRRTVVVIGGVHGNEPISPPIVRGLVDAAIPPDVAIWLVPAANPDGVAAGTRCSATGVDLNRNFPWRWSASDGGPAPLSEPETRAIVDLVGRLRPDLVVWVHQPLGYVSSIGPTSDALEQAWASASGVPVRPNVTQHGGGESWTAFVAGRPSMLIEADTWSATEAGVAAHRAGFEAAVAALE